MAQIARAIVRTTKGMNKTESAYAYHLHQRVTAGELRSYAFQAITLKLADDTRYTPDFFVVAADGCVEMHEVKGFWRDDAKVKIKVGARAFPFRFYSAQKTKVGWDVRDFTDGEVTP